MSADKTQSISRLLSEWRLRARANQLAHYEAADRLQRMNYLLGVPVVILSATVGTSIFATLQNEFGLWPKILVGMVSVTVSVLSALQTFFKSSERAEQHRTAAARFGALNREIETLEALGLPPDADTRQILDELQSRMNELGEQSPHISGKLLEAAGKIRLVRFNADS